ncbi:hypothetical protein BUC_5737 [Burkholderia pseudomallei 576]|nr:hypothetical protein BUC_5737 [Burkholderia pseudomallei 576]
MTISASNRCCAVRGRMGTLTRVRTDALIVGEIRPSFMLCLKVIQH